MTRENKLALVVGFGLILVVGILISDHFSVGSQRESAELGGIVDPLAARTEDGGRLVEFKAASNNRIESSPPPQAAMSTGQVPLDQQGALRPRPEQPNPSQLPGGAAITANDHGDDGFDLQLDVADDPQREALASRSSDDTVVADAAPPQAPTTTTITTGGNGQSHRSRPGERTYRVKSRDSLTLICKRFYGDASLVKQLAAYNNIPDPNRITEGVSLAIPEAYILKQGNTRRSSASSATQDDASQSTRQASGAGSTPPKTYKVKKDDTLSELSLKLLGTSKRWRELWKFNESVIKNPDKLIAGTVIRVPPK